MSLGGEVRYLLDPCEIQDKIAFYGLGHDLHQPDSDDKNVLAQWNELFTPDAEIELTSLRPKVSTCTVVPN